MTELNILVPTCKRETDHALLPETLRRLKEAMPNGAKLYVLDTSTQESEGDNIGDIRNLERINCPGDSKPTAINKALEVIAPSKFVAIIDDDILVPKQYFEVALSFLNSNSDALGVGGIYLDTALERFIAQRKINFIKIFSSLIGLTATSTYNKIKKSGFIANLTLTSLNHPVSGNWLFGCNAVYRYQTLLTDAPFPTGMKGWSYGDDIWVGAQLMQRGCSNSLFVHPQLSVIHLGDKTSSSNKTDSLYTIILHSYIISRKLRSGKSASPSYYFVSIILILYYKIFLGYSGCSRSALLLIRLLLIRGQAPGFKSALSINQ